MMDRERPAAPQGGPIPEAWIGQEVMIETTEVLSSDLRASAPVYLEDVNERGIVMMVTRHRDQNQFSRYFYPWGWWAGYAWRRTTSGRNRSQERPSPRAAQPRPPYTGVRGRGVLGTSGVGGSRKFAGSGTGEVRLARVRIPV
jgi:hypothetical protein